MEVHFVDDQQGLYEAGRREAGLGPRPARQSDLDLYGAAGVRGDLDVLRAADPEVDRECDAEQADGATGAVHRRAVRRDPGVSGSRDAGEPADQRGDRRTEVGGRRARPSTAIRRGRPPDIPGEVMTVTADTE